MSCKTKHTIKEQERQQESTTISNVKDSIKNNIKFGNPSATDE